MSGWLAVPLWKRVLGALVLGLIFAPLWPAATPAVAFMGDLFVRAIRMLDAPMVLVTIASGIATLGDPKRLGGLFALTTVVAVSVGMAVAALLRPGVDAPLGTAASEQTALVVGFVLPFDLLDMTRTVPSVCANLAAATTVARLGHELDEETYRSTHDA